MEIYIPEDLRVKDLQRMMLKLVSENPKKKIKFNIQKLVVKIEV